MIVQKKHVRVTGTTTIAFRARFVFFAALVLWVTACQPSGSDPNVVELGARSDRSLPESHSGQGVLALERVGPEVLSAGSVPLLEMARTSHTIRNRSDGSIRIVNLGVSCPCLQVVFDDEVLEPGAETRVSLSFTMPPDPHHVLTHYVTLTAFDAKNKEMKPEDLHAVSPVRLGIQAAPLANLQISHDQMIEHEGFAGEPFRIVFYLRTYDGLPFDGRVDVDVSDLNVDVQLTANEDFPDAVTDVILSGTYPQRPDVWEGGVHVHDNRQGTVMSRFLAMRSVPGWHAEPAGFLLRPSLDDRIDMSLTLKPWSEQSLKRADPAALHARIVPETGDLRVEMSPSDTDESVLHVRLSGTAAALTSDIGAARIEVRRDDGSLAADLPVAWWRRGSD